MKRNLTEISSQDRLSVQTFSINERIKKPDEIKRLFNEGKKVSVFGAKLFFIENNLGYSRIAFPLPRGFGNAVERNKCKRYSRESYRKIKAYLNNGYDILLLVYPSEKDSFSTRCAQFQTLLKKAGMMIDEKFEGSVV